MSNDQNDLRDLKLMVLDDLMRSLMKHRRQALVSLLMVLVATLLVQTLDPNEMPGVIVRVGQFFAVAALGLCSTVYLGATVWLWRLRKERADTLRGE